MIWIVALLLILVWPPAEGRSLGVKLVNWGVDPRGALPALPETLPPGLDDNGDAVTEHDLLEQEYYRARDRSSTAKWRMDMKEWSDPITPETERQVLVAMAVLGGLLVWRLAGTDR